jgi:DNA-binding response OmpR family regulator
MRHHDETTLQRSSTEEAATANVPPPAQEARAVTGLGATATWHGLPVGRRVLVAEDDPAMRDLVALVLREQGYQVEMVSSGSELKSLLSEADPTGHFDLIVTGGKMPDGSALDVIDQLRQNGDSTPALVVTAFPRDDIRQRARDLELRLLAKPFDLDVLRSAVDWVIRSNAPHQWKPRWPH